MSMWVMSPCAMVAPFAAHSLRPPRARHKRVTRAARDAAPEAQPTRLAGETL